MKKSETKELLTNWIEFWYIGVYDLEHRIDSRKMWISYVLELIQEMLDSKAYKNIDFYYGWIWKKHSLKDCRKTDLDYFENAIYEMSI